MKCFHFINITGNGSGSGEKKTNSKSSASTSTSMDRCDTSVTNNNSISDTSTTTESPTPFTTTLSHRSNNLRVFTVSELKSATKNFSRSLVIGEGGFGCVYKGLVKDTHDPQSKLTVAVKQLGKRGLQASFHLPSTTITFSFSFLETHASRNRYSLSLLKRGNHIIVA